jgi:hypothetical protein
MKKRQRKREKAPELRVQPPHASELAGACFGPRGRSVAPTSTGMSCDGPRQVRWPEPQGPRSERPVLALLGSSSGREDLSPYRGR